MVADWLLIDGNNLVHQAPGELVGDVARDFRGARERLSRHMDTLAGHLARRVTIVYDGTIAGRDTHFDASSVEVVFCGPEETADGMIEHLVLAHPRTDGILVVTSDRAERETVAARGARTMSCAAFLDALGQARADLDRELRVSRGVRPAGMTIGDVFPG